MFIYEIKVETSNKGNVFLNFNLFWGNYVLNRSILNLIYLKIDNKYKVRGHSVEKLWTIIQDFRHNLLIVSRE